jgi:hypothetical protein
MRDAATAASVGVRITFSTSLCVQQLTFATSTSTFNLCDATLNYNQGCGVKSPSSRSFGAPFNAAGGGWFAMRRTKRDGVAVWFWSRDDPTVPPEVSGLPLNTSAPVHMNAAGLVLVEAIVEGKEVIQPSEHWGTPEAVFPAESCSHKRFFDDHLLVFDLTFCGDWAGEPTIWAKSGCGVSGARTCNSCSWSLTLPVMSGLIRHDRC